MYVKTVNYRSSEAAKDLANSFQETGFAVLKNHPISNTLMQDVLDEWKDFFGGEEKFSYLFTDPKWGELRYKSGYFPFRSENARGYDKKNLMEYFHYYKKSGLPKGLSDNTTLLFDQLCDLGIQILDWLHQETPPAIRAQYSVPLPQMIDRHSSDILMRFIHYPPLEGTEEPGAFRAAEHEDINMITLLAAASSKGLQVKDLQGNWHDVSSDPEELVINTCDMLQMASQGYFRSTTHRVINPEGENSHLPRYSMPFFMGAKGDTRLSKEYTAEKYLRERLKENGVLKESENE